MRQHRLDLWGRCRGLEVASLLIDKHGQSGLCTQLERAWQQSTGDLRIIVTIFHYDELSHVSHNDSDPDHVRQLTSSTQHDPYDVSAKT